MSPQIVDFAIWMLFSKAHKTGGRVKHLLCQGFRKDVSFYSVRRDENPTSAIPDVVSTYPNSHVKSIKASPWPQVLMLMGKERDRVMIDLILDCGIFLPVGSGHGSYYQLSGKSISSNTVLLFMQTVYDRSTPERNPNSSKFTSTNPQVSPRTPG
jgi:telomerase reverse transcriptase